MQVENDPWCSSGGLALDGTLVGTGGWDNGIKTVRYLKTCNGCEFQEYQTALADPRWYVFHSFVLNIIISTNILFPCNRIHDTESPTTVYK